MVILARLFEGNKDKQDMRQNKFLFLLQ